MNESHRRVRLAKSSNRLSCQTAVRQVQPSFKSRLAQATRVMAPTLFALTFASVAHAQGTMDFSGAQTLMGTFKTFAIYAGAVICFGGLIFAGIRMLSGRFQDAIPGLFGALFGAGVLGWGAGWIGSLTGQSM
ncbi:traI protein (DNA helicase I) [Acidisarcina polymorpha]|uniref:TraI protein (DNA helicase I) n=2 Tax=Acidisarcina polymorpha TaxID=2211140 RepID=A0A2Z5G4I2_9BACT|nr:traI protein (DNA helicase I) [Acidisarcina polymorpha]